MFLTILGIYMYVLKEKLFLQKKKKVYLLKWNQKKMEG